MRQVRVALVGLGNCASAFMQGIEYYRSHPGEEMGLLFPSISGLKPNDISIVAAFDVTESKVGKDIAEAIFASPNNTSSICDVPESGIAVSMGHVLDGAGNGSALWGELSKKRPDNVARTLREAHADVLVNLLPSGAVSASRFYATQALQEAGVAFVNGSASLICNQKELVDWAVAEGLPLVGDDFKSQCGTTVFTRALLQMVARRGGTTASVQQMNWGGNADFANLVVRPDAKRASKNAAMEKIVPHESSFDTGFGFLPSLRDEKRALVEINACQWAGSPIRVRLELAVSCDSAGAAGVMVDLVRFCKCLLESRRGGISDPLCSFYMKSPPTDMPEEQAFPMLQAIAAETPGT